MSSLEMLALLELAHGRPLIHGQEREQPSNGGKIFRLAIRKLIGFGKRSLRLLSY
jgi:NitT/TauT family transport system permease protein